MTQAVQASSKDPAKPTIVVSRDKKTLTVRIPVKFRVHRAGKQIVTPSGEAWAPALRVDSALVQALVRAHRWREMLETGKHGTAADLAKAEKLNDSYLSRMLRLTLLAPDIVETILDGRQPRSLELSTLLQPLPFSWKQQRKLLGFQGTVAKVRFRNYYCCPCGCEWHDDWDSTCDDRCPQCDISCSPIESDDLPEPVRMAACQHVIYFTLE